MLIFIYGTDTFRSREKLQEAKRQFKEKHDASGMNIIELDGAHSSLEELGRAVTSSPFLSSKRLIIVKSFTDGDYDPDRAIVILRSAPAGNTVLIYETKSGKDVKKLLAEKPEAVYEFAPMEGAELLRWIVQRGKSRGLSFVGKSATRLTELVENNTWQLATEINKLSNFGKKEINEDDVLCIVSGGLASSAFQFIDAFASRQGERTLLLLRRELEANNDSGRLFHLVARQIRILLQIKKPALSEQAKIDLPPFVVEKARKQAALWQNDALRAAYEQLLEIDKNTKSTTLSPETLLTHFVALNCEAPFSVIPAKAGA